MNATTTIGPELIQANVNVTIENLDAGCDDNAITTSLLGGFELAVAQTILQQAKVLRAQRDAAAASDQVEVGAASAEQTTSVAAAFVDPMPMVPASLKNIPNWIHWKLEPDKNSRPTKVPYQVNGQYASSTNPATWVDYKTATAGATINGTQGVGFVVDGGVVGFDLDGCRNPQTGKLTDWAEQIIDALDSYTEITPSLTGARVWVRGELPPNADKIFNLDLAAGFGEKVKIEVFTDSRYFTVTGDSYFEEAGEVEQRDLADVYKLLHDIRAKYPAAKKEKATTDSGSNQPIQSTQIEKIGGFETSKYDIFMHGTIESQSPFVISNGNGRLEYPSQSEADMAFATVLAIRYEGDRDKISTDFRNSPLYRPKWDRLEESTITKAIESAQKTKTAASAAVVIQETAPVETKIADDFGAESIPPFDKSVITGIYAKFVELITRGTTLDPQFAFLAAKVVVGARMAGKVHFENLDAEPRYYGAAIGETGSGKGEAWRRMMQILNAVGSLDSSGDCGIKVINSADSGAGIRDVFFEHPEELPVLCYVDEVESLGNKATATRNPAILDMIIELANSTRISRTKAKKKGDAFSGTKTKNDARFCMFMCGQDGDTYMKAFAGRTKLGMWDRLYPEFGTAVEAGDLPAIHVADAFTLLTELNNLNYSGTMTMSPESKARFDAFWSTQPKDVKAKARWKNNLVMDAYMAAFGRGSKQVEIEDIDTAIRIFTRQLVIRRVCFSNEIPDRIGYYLGKIKEITKRMEKRLAAGVPSDQVALSRRDYETLTNAFRDNEEHVFERAWLTHSKVHLGEVEIQKANGQKYKKYLPLAYD